MIAPRPILIATRNAGKVREIVAVLTDNEPFWNGRVEWRSLEVVWRRASRCSSFWDAARPSK